MIDYPSSLHSDRLWNPDQTENRPTPEEPMPGILSQNSIKPLPALMLHKDPDDDCHAAALPMHVNGQWNNIGCNVLWLREKHREATANHDLPL